MGLRAAGRDRPLRIQGFRLGLARWSPCSCRLFGAGAFLRYFSLPLLRRGGPAKKLWGRSVSQKDMQYPWQEGSSKMKMAAFLMGAALSSPISALAQDVPPYVGFKSGNDLLAEQRATQALPNGGVG